MAGPREFCENGSAENNRGKPFSLCLFRISLFPHFANKAYSYLPELWCIRLVLGPMESMSIAKSNKNDLQMYKVFVS